MNPKDSSTGRRVAFDIEIGNIFELAPGEDLDQYGPFDITCAAAFSEGGDLRHWYTRDAAGGPGPMMDTGTARELLEWLRAEQQDGARVCAWNGLSFDLRWIGVVAKAPELAAEIALDMFDPMFQFFVQRGFPVALAKVAEGLGVTETKLMHGADAPVEWKDGKYERVLEYVAGDCRITEAVVARIEANRGVRWRTQRGTVSSEPMPVLKPVRELLNAPEPDVSWMDSPLPRAKFTHWLPAEVLARHA